MELSLVEEAVNRFKEGFSCSQAVFLTYGKHYGINENVAKTIARSFGGGMGRTCQTCGAVTGAYMVLGFINEGDNEKSSKEKTYAHVQEFSRRFHELHGNVNCQQLLGCDLGTAEGQDYFRSNNLNQRCTGFVKDSALILEKLINE
jgi:C_GCAxxG_C_C family probable redox protein